MLFNKTGGQRSPEKTAAEVRTSIYQFQKQQIEDERKWQEQQQQQRERTKRIDAFPTLDKDAKPTAENVAKPTERARFDMFTGLFNAPKPARPQLHAFF